jgi:DNA primase
MRFDERFLDEIKSRLRLSEVIGRSVKLRRQGREYVGLSPFAKERTPSFFVNDDKGFFHDFSSGKHGDLISFLQETERLSFVEAVERLAAEAGLALPEQDPRAAEQERERQTLSDWLEQAAKWFEAALRRPVGADARAYLARRGLPEADWARFRIGFAPNSRTALKDYLVERGAKPGELVETGMLIQPEGGGASYDRFRDRIIFPISDNRGRVLSFGGRAMDPEARAKYLNGPETDLFHKGRTLYGVGEARRLISAGGAGEANSFVVVEGFMDAIACQRINIPAVASLGTALTEEQMEALWRLAPDPVLCFDGDDAGQRAAFRVLDRALPLLKPARSFRFALLTGGKDPDDVLRDHGPAALKAQLRQTVPFSEFLFRREVSETPLDTPEQRAGLKVRLRQLARGIPDVDLAEQYRRDLLARFEQTFPRQQFVPGWGAKSADILSIVRTKNAAHILRERAKRLNAALAVKGIESPAWLLPYVEELSAFGFGDRQLTKLVRPLVEGLSQSAPTPKMLRSFIYNGNVEPVFDTAFRIANEAPVLPFMDRDVPEDVAHFMWTRAFEGMVELEALKAEVADGPRVEDPNGEIEHRAKLRARRHLLERQLSDLTIWDRAA